MIELSTYDEGNYKVLEVKDNGLGLDLKKYGSKVFGMYKTFHGNEDARGFGLYITKTQIEAMGGKITLASEPDKGSTFKVYFYDSGE
jgi:sensor histidine kinase regulating citrate/malate metabolism